MGNLKIKYGDWALITGASSGIGEEFAKVLASQGINLVLVARRKELLINLSKELIDNYGIEVVISNVDLASDNFLENIISDINGREISILINNAGIGKPGIFIKENITYEKDLLSVNCVAPLILANYFANRMIKRKRGAIIFIGSVVAYQPTPVMSSYSATKAFILSLGNALWYELREFGIDVLTVHPGNTATEFNRIILNNNSILTRKASQVVKTSLKYLGKKPNVVDGVVNKIMTSLSKHFNIRLITSITGKLMLSFYKNNYLVNK